MKITNVFVFVELDNSDELRQLFIKNGPQKELLIQLINQGVFHEKEVTISDKVTESLEIVKEEEGT